MRSFKSEGQFEIQGRGTVYATVADRQMDRDHPDVLGETVLIDDKPMVVKGVERFLPMSPIRVGESIGLLAIPAEIHP